MFGACWVHPVGVQQSGLGVVPPPLHSRTCAWWKSSMLDRLPRNKENPYATLPSGLHVDMIRHVNACEGQGRWEAVR